jgi:hypothetical protein
MERRFGFDKKIAGGVARVSADRRNHSKKKLSGFLPKAATPVLAGILTRQL